MSQNDSYFVNEGLHFLLLNRGSGDPPSSEEWVRVFDMRQQKAELQEMWNSLSSWNRCQFPAVFQASWERRTFLPPGQSYPRCRRKWWKQYRWLRPESYCKSDCSVRDLLRQQDPKRLYKQKLIMNVANKSIMFFLTFKRILIEIKWILLYIRSLDGWFV